MVSFWEEGKRSAGRWSVVGARAAPAASRAVGGSSSLRGQLRGKVALCPRSTAHGQLTTDYGRPLSESKIAEADSDTVQMCRKPAS